MSVKLLTEQHFRFLSLTGDCRGSSESIQFKMPHCLKSHVKAHIYNKVRIVHYVFKGSIIGRNFQIMMHFCP